MRKNNKKEKEVWRNAIAELQLGDNCAVILLALEKNETL